MRRVADAAGLWTPSVQAGGGGGGPAGVGQHTQHDHVAAALVFLPSAVKAPGDAGSRAGRKRGMLTDNR